MSDGMLLIVALLVALVYSWPWWALAAIVLLLLGHLGRGSRRG